MDGSITEREMTADFDPEATLARIKEFTERADIIPLKSIGTFINNEVTYECEKGNCRGWALWKTEGCAVQYAEMEADTIMREHTHTGNKEILVVIEGELFSRIGDEVSSAKVGECIVIPAETTHTPFTEIQTKVIGITIPASEGYPNVGAK